MLSYIFGGCVWITCVEKRTGYPALDVAKVPMWCVVVRLSVKGKRSSQRGRSICIREHIYMIFVCVMVARKLLIGWKWRYPWTGGAGQLFVANKWLQWALATCLHYYKILDDDLQMIFEKSPKYSKTYLLTIVCSRDSTNYNTPMLRPLALVMKDAVALLKVLILTPPRGSEFQAEVKKKSLVCPTPKHIQGPAYLTGSGSLYTSGAGFRDFLDLCEKAKPS